MKKEELLAIMAAIVFAGRAGSSVDVNGAVANAEALLNAVKARPKGK